MVPQSVPVWNLRHCHLWTQWIVSHKGSSCVTRARAHALCHFCCMFPNTFLINPLTIVIVWMCFYIVCWLRMLWRVFWGGFAWVHNGHGDQYGSENVLLFSYNPPLKWRSTPCFCSPCNSEIQGDILQMLLFYYYYSVPFLPFGMGARGQSAGGSYPFPAERSRFAKLTPPCVEGGEECGCPPTHLWRVGC